MEKRKVRKNKKKNRVIQEVIYALIIIILIFLIILFAIRTYENYSVWQQRQSYFHQHSITIQSWMTLREISHNFNLTYPKIYSTIGNTTVINSHLSLNRFCIVYNKNCNQLVAELNNLIK